MALSIGGGGPSFSSSKFGLDQPAPGFAERCREACRTLFDKIGHWAGGESFAYKQLSKFGDALSGLKGSVDKEVLKDLQEHAKVFDAYSKAFDGAATSLQALRTLTGPILTGAADKFKNTPTEVVKQAEDKIAGFFRFDARVCDLATGKLHAGVNAGMLLKNAHKFGLSREEVKEILSIRSEIGQKCDSEYGKLHQSFKESTGFVEPLTNLVESDKKFFNSPNWGKFGRNPHVGPDVVAKVKESYELARTEIVESELMPLITKLIGEGKENEIGKAVTDAAGKLKAAQDEAMETVKLCKTISKAEKTTADFLEKVGLKQDATGPVEYKYETSMGEKCRATFSPDLSDKLRSFAGAATTGALQDCLAAKQAFCSGTGKFAALKESVEKLDQSHKNVSELLKQVTSTLDQFAVMSTESGYENKTRAQRDIDKISDQDAREAAEFMYSTLKNSAEEKAATAFDRVAAGGLESAIKGLRSAGTRTDLFESALFGIVTSPSKASDVAFMCDNLSGGLAKFEADVTSSFASCPVVVDILQEKAAEVASNFKSALVAEGKKPESDRFPDPDDIVKNLANYDALLQKAQRVAKALEAYPSSDWDKIGRKLWDIS
jgi:hypothetical protein